MNGKKERTLLKNTSRRLLLGNYGLAVRCVILVQIVQTTLSLALMMTGSGIGVVSSYLVSFVCFVLTGVLSSGYCKVFIRLARGETPAFQDMLFPFRDHTDTIIVVIAYRLLIVTVWYIPFSQLIMAIRGSQSEGGVSPLTIILFILVSAVLGLTALAIELRYIMATFLFADHPDWKASRLLRCSREITDGHYKELALLILSFAGYLALSILSLGIGMLWVTPYVMETLSLYYLQMTSSADEDGPHVFHK